MKNLSFLFLFLLTISACTPKKPSADAADKHVEYMMLRMDLCKKVYTTFITMIPEEHNIASNIGVNASYDVMIDTFEEERAILEKMKVWEGAPEDVERSQKMKAAAMKIVNGFYEGGQNELTEAKKLINSGATASSKSVNDLLNAFETKVNQGYEEFGTEQKIFAETYGLILY